MTEPTRLAQHRLAQAKEVTPIALPAAMAHARRETGKSVAAQAFEMLLLRRGIGGITPEEYIANRLYDDRLFDMAAKRRFLGVNGEHTVDRICNADHRWRAPVRDKIVFTAMMTGLGFPVPELIAFHHARRRCFMGADLKTREDLTAFLRGLDRPVFGKPLGGRWSLGAASLEGYDKTADAVTTLGGQPFPVETLADEIAAFAEEGYLFQERLTPHAMLARVCGPAVGTVRLLTGMSPDGPELLAAVWKVIAGGNIADNFWRAGNMLAAVEGESGTVTRVASGLGREHRTHEDHPDSGERLQGLVLPDWQEARALCLSAATALGGLRLIGWDIALTARGPVIVEANTLPAFNLHQIATGKGLLDGHFAAFVESCRR